jgi:hypothetical protein
MLDALVAAQHTAGMSFLQYYLATVDWIVTLAPVDSDKIVHTYVGLAIWLGTAVVLRRSLGSRLPLLAVIAAELANEVFDFFGRTHWNWPDTRGDLIATWFWPFVLFAALRWLPGLARRRD